MNTERFQYIQNTIQLNFGEYWTFEPELIEGFKLDRDEAKRIEKADADYWNEQFERLLTRQKILTTSSNLDHSIEDCEGNFIPPESHPNRSYRLETYVQNASATPYTHPVLIP